MGSKGMKRRKPHRPPDAARRDHWPEEDALGSRYTFESYLRDLGRFVRGANRARGWRRTVGLAVIWTFLGSMLVGIVLGASSLVSAVLR